MDRRLALACLALAAAPLLIDAPSSAAPPPAAPAAPRVAAAASRDFLARPPQLDRLENGLTVVTLPMPGAGTIAYYTLVRAGSRDEVEPGKSGYAHLFEHLMFRGTAKMPAAEYDRRMQAMGSDNNAFTTPDFTLYIPTIPKESLAELVPVEAERFEHLDVPQAAYRDETGAVLGEYNKSFSNPGRALDEALLGLAFRAHTYGHTTLGTRRDVEAMPAAYEYSRAFFRRFYTPDDCTIFVVGDFDRAKVLDLVRASYKDWQGKRAATEVPVEPEQHEPRTTSMTWKGPTTPRVAIGYKIPHTGASLRDAAALSLVAALALGPTSELYQRLVVAEQKVIDLSCDPDDLLHRDPGLFRIDAKLKPATSSDEVVHAVDEALAKVARGELRPERLEAVRAHLLNDAALELKTPSTVATRLAIWTAVTSDVHAFETYGHELSQATAADVARVAAAYLVASRRSVATLTSGGKK